MLVDLSQYRGLFIEEARRHLRIAEGLLSAETLTDTDFSTLFRVFHTIKGMAATMSLPSISMLAQSLEHFVGEARSGAFRPGEQAMDLLVEGLDLLVLQLSAVEENREPLPADDYEERLRTLLVTGSVSSFTFLEDTRDSATDLSPESQPVEPIDNVLLAFAQALSSCQAIRARGTGDMRVALGRLDDSLTVLWEGILASRTVSFSVVAPALRRQVQAIARRYQRRVHFDIRGEDQKSHHALLLRLEPAIINVLRQIIARGFEDEPKRIQKGKGPIGHVLLGAECAGNSFKIVIQDDGSGQSDFEGSGQGIEDQAWESRESERQSTAPRSARMLAQTWQTVDALAGRLSVVSEIDKGTTWTIEVPVPAQVVELVEVEAGGHTLGIPRFLLDAGAIEVPSELPALLGLPVQGNLGLKAVGGQRVRVDSVRVPFRALVIQPPFPLHRARGVLGLALGADGALMFIVRPIP